MKGRRKLSKTFIFFVRCTTINFLQCHQQLLNLKAFCQQDPSGNLSSINLENTYLQKRTIRTTGNTWYISSQPNTERISKAIFMYACYLPVHCCSKLQKHQESVEEVSEKPNACNTSKPIWTQGKVPSWWGHDSESWENIFPMPWLSPLALLGKWHHPAQ